MMRYLPIIGEASDGGASSRRLHSGLDVVRRGAKAHDARLRAAKRRVRDYDKSLISVFKLIVSFGSNRRESIGALERCGMSSYAASAKYYRDRKKLLQLFGISRENTNLLT